MVWRLVIMLLISFHLLDFVLMLDVDLFVLLLSGCICWWFDCYVVLCFRLIVYLWVTCLMVWVYSLCVGGIGLIGCFCYWFVRVIWLVGWLFVRCSCLLCCLLCGSRLGTSVGCLCLFLNIRLFILLFGFWLVLFDLFMYCGCWWLLDG